MDEENLPPEGAQLLTRVSALVRENLSLFEEAGVNLDTEFGMDAVIRRDEAEEKRWKGATRSILKGRDSDGSPIVGRELIYPDGIPNIQSSTDPYLRLCAAFEAFIEADRLDPTWRETIHTQDPPEAQVVVLLTWLIADQDAHALRPYLTKQFGGLPWNLTFSESGEGNESGRETVRARMDMCTWLKIARAALTAMECSGLMPTASGSARGEKRGSRRRSKGRTRQYDPREDEKLIEAYDRSQLSPKEFARIRHGVEERDIVCAQGRLRKARWRAKQKSSRTK